MTELDRWILERAVSVLVPIHLIVDSEQSVEARWNVPWHGHSIREVVAQINELRARGFLRILEGDVDREAICVSDIRGSSVSSCSLEERVAYCLTSEGGEYWQRVASTKWEDFYSMESRDDHWIRISAVSPSTVCEAAAMHCFYENLIAPIATFVIEEVAPWQATYWKVFERGYSACFFGAVEEDGSAQAEYRYVMNDLAMSQLKGRMEQLQRRFDSWRYSGVK